MTDPYSYLQHMDIVNHLLLYVWNGCGSHCHGIICGHTSDTVQLTSQIWANKFGSNGMMTDPYSHPQHMKVVNHFVYIWSGCGRHSMLG